MLYADLSAVKKICQINAQYTTAGATTVKIRKTIVQFTDCQLMKNRGSIGLIVFHTLTYLIVSRQILEFVKSTGIKMLRR